MNIEICPLGDQALLVNFEQLIDVDTHLKVMNLTIGLKQAAIEGVRFVSPAYCSLTVGYDPNTLSYRKLAGKIKQLANKPVPDQEAEGKKITVPVCYDEAFGLDLQAISVLSGVSTEEVIELHSNQIYRVYMLGFLPGFPYLGVVPPKLQLARKEQPRLSVPERSVAIAGKQTGIYPAESPGGWHVLGQTPLPLLGKQSSGFMMEPGDQVQFHPITMTEYQQISQQVDKGTFNWNSIYG